MVLTEYFRLLRPSVLRQLNPGMVRLLNEMPGLAKQNSETVGRVFVTGGLGHAKKGPGGRMRAKTEIRAGQLVWSPSVIVMPSAGDLDLEIINNAADPHDGMFPSNGDKQFIWLPGCSRGTVTLNLDGPGYYWFSSVKGNEEGRGLVGVILVQGAVPQQARLDRPPQPQP